MEFISAQDFDNDGEALVWDAVKGAFASDEGYAWHKYPLTSSKGPRLQPDILIIHPEWGINVLEVKACRITDIEVIEGDIWYMSKDWNLDQITPRSQAEKHAFSIRDKIRDHRPELRNNRGDCKVVAKAFVTLPFINEPEWRNKFTTEGIGVYGWELIFRSGMYPPNLLRACVVNAPLKQERLTDEEWNALISLMRNAKAVEKTPRRPTKKKDSRAALLRQVEQRMERLDLEQHRFAIQIPNGPQRLRGLAGTGKTIVLTQKAAHMHVNNPEWDIVFTFYSRSLYGQVQERIRQAVQEFSHGEMSEPNWEKLHVWHAWGSSRQAGLYSELCEYVDAPFRSLKGAEEQFATRSGRVAFDKCCEELLEFQLTELYDAIKTGRGFR